MGQADTGSKQTINIYNKAWAEWVLQAEDVAVEAELSGEFQFIARASDSLMQVRGRDGRFLSLTKLQLRNPVLLPFTPLMEGGNTEEVLRSCVTRIRKEPRALELETILSVFASYVMDTDVIKRIVRWEMNILKESPILQEALAERYETGQREGKFEESLAWLQRILAVRFQLDEVGFEKRGLAELTLEQLESLGEVALTAVTLAEFDEAVNQTKE
jgi:predicted transposase YdaD